MRIPGLAGGSQTGELELRQLLLGYWDVVGVRDLDEEPEAEYADEANRLGGLLRTGASERDVEKALSEFAAELSVDADHRRDARAADAIVGWYGNAAPG